MIHLAIKPKTISIKFFIRKLSLLNDLFYLLLSEAKQDVFWLKVCVNYSANAIKEVEPHEYLS